MNTEIGIAASSVNGSSSINQQRESELRTQVEMQKKKVLELNRARGEMGVLLKDVETAQKAMDAVSLRFSQTSIEGQSNQSDIAILNPAIAPLNPNSPKLLLSLVLAIMLGGILGIGFGLFAELLDRRVRSRDDISNILGVPVFAIIVSKPKPSSRKLFPRNNAGLLTA